MKTNKKRAETQGTEFNPSSNSKGNDESREEIKARKEQQITRSMSHQLKERQAAQAIPVINHLIIPSSGKLKLRTIATKRYQSIKLTQEETTFWNSFSNIKKSYILTSNW
jgi:hypothetical protein